MFQKLEKVLNNNISKKDKNASLHDIVEVFYEDKKDKEMREKLHINYQKLFSKENIIKVLTILIIVNCAVITYRYMYSLQRLNSHIISNNPIYLIVSFIAPFIIWILSTDELYWQFHNRKIALFMIAVANAMLTILQPFYTFYWNIAVSLFFKLTTDEVFTEGMVIMDAQVMIFILEGLTGFVIWHTIVPYFLDEVTIVKLKRFKLSHYVDNRSGKEYLYDLKIIKNLETARDINIKESDRLVHMFINGASGTGKTSSAILPAIANDMNIKYQNKQLRQNELIKMLLSKEASYAWPTNEFEEYRVIPKKKYIKKYQKIYKKYPDCGMTIMAPNNSIIDDVIRLANARNLEVNVLDPAAAYFDQFVKEKGINPFYIPLGLSERDRVIRINDAATIFSEVLIAVNEGSKEPDQYFSDISKSVTTNIAQVCMLARNIEGRQTNITEIQKCISDFQKINTYVKTIENHYGMNVEQRTKDKDKDGSIQQLKDLTNSNTEKRKTNGENNPYYESIFFVKNELLGAGADKMYDQARGLRNLMNKILNDPRFKEILSADVSARVDFDQMLAENQIVCVNTALELGSERSTTFGLFYLLTQKASVLRRPKDKRSLHFIWVDELSQYLHPSLEDMVTLYRQYGVAVSFAIQSRAQMHKNSMTKYLDDVFDGVGTHIVFGRLSPEDMKKYSEMAGKSKQDSVQKTISGNSILSDNPTETWSERTTTTLENNLEGTDMRYMDFQEITIMTTDNGRPINAVLGKVFFLKDSDYEKRKERKLKWKLLSEKIDIGNKENEEIAVEEPIDVPKYNLKSNLSKDALDTKVTTRILDTDKQENLINWDSLEPVTPNAADERKTDNIKTVAAVPEKQNLETITSGNEKKFEVETNPIRRLDVLMFEEFNANNEGEDVQKDEIEDKVEKLEKMYQKKVIYKKKN